MNSIAEFKRRYIDKTKNNNGIYKMDWFDDDKFDESIFARPNNKSRRSPPIEKAALKSSPKEEKAAVDLEKAELIPKRESKLVILRPISPRTRKMRQDTDAAEMLKINDELSKPRSKIINPYILRSRRPHRDGPTNLDPTGRTMHQCANLLPKCRSISQMKHRGAYSIVYTNGTEIVIPTFEQLVDTITNDYMTANIGRIPENQRSIHKQRITETLNTNGVFASARGVKTKKNKQKQTKRRRKRRGKK